MYDSLVINEFGIPEFQNSYMNFDFGKPVKKSSNKNDISTSSPFNWVTITLIVLVLIILILVILIACGVFDTSEKGVDGKIGEVGPTGMEGPTGSTGIEGPTGSIGPTGQLDGNYNGVITAKGFSTGVVTSLGLNAGATGIYNTFVGTSAGDQITTGNHNVFVGTDAGSSVSNSDGNTFVGRNAGGTITTGDDNTVIGRGAGGSITTGQTNVIIGSIAGRFLDAASSGNIAIGYSSGPSTLSTQSKTMWLPKGTNALTAISGGGSGVYLLAYDTTTGRVFPINGGSVETSSIPTD